MGKSRLGEKLGKETQSGQKPKGQLPGEEERNAEKDIKENGTVAEPGCAERTWVVHRRDRVSWKGDRAALGSWRRKARLRRVRACRVGPAKRLTCGLAVIFHKLPKLDRHTEQRNHPRNTWHTLCFPADDSRRMQPRNVPSGLPCLDKISYRGFCQ